MFEGIDVVRYTQMSRLLKVAEEYGKRLLLPLYGERKAGDLAHKLVANYPEHGFPIYSEELSSLGFVLPRISDRLDGILEHLSLHIPGNNLIGRLN